jgi:hypothetical protein
VSGGFEIIDWMSSVDNSTQTRPLPRLGRVEPSGNSYRFSLIGNRDAGQITPHTASPDNDAPDIVVRKDVDHYDIDASPELQHNAIGQTLLLAAALTVAWWPPPG